MISDLRHELAEVERAAGIAAMFGLSGSCAAMRAKAAVLRNRIRLASLTEVERLVKGGAE